MFLKSEIWVWFTKNTSTWRRSFSMKLYCCYCFSSENLRNYEKVNAKNIYIRRRPPKFWIQNIFNCNLQQNLRFLQHSSRHYYRVRSSQQRCSVKIGVLRNFTKFTGQHLCLQLYLKRDSGTGVFLWILLNF